MTDYDEEQAMELEAMASIFMDDYTGPDVDDPDALAAMPRPYTFAIKLVPDPAADDAENHVGVVLRFSLPPTYPDVLPDLELAPVKGKPLRGDQLETLRALCTETGEGLLGMPMAFSVCEAAKEWLVEHNEPAGDGSGYAAMMKRQKDAARAEEAADAAAAQAEAAEAEAEWDDEAMEKERARRRAAGTACTPESFAAWRDRFDAEVAEAMRAARAARLASKDKAVVAAATAEAKREERANRQTGKQLFQQDASFLEAAELEAAAGAAAAEAAADAAAAAEQGGGGGGGGDGGGAIDDALFTGEDGLDDLDFGDD